jgi:hypothetical protein
MPLSRAGAGLRGGGTGLRGPVSGDGRGQWCEMGALVRMQPACGRAAPVDVPARVVPLTE